MTKILLALGFLILNFGCASSPKVDQSHLTQSDAVNWLNQYCSKIDFKKAAPELSGDVVMKSTTPEFKGQYPASIHFDSNGVFTMEITNVIGGTLLRIQGSPDGIDLTAPSRPQYNRKGVRSYLGLELEILMQLFHGDMACPLNEKGDRRVRTQGNTILSESSLWKWTFERAAPVDGSVPVHIQLVSKALEKGTAKPIAVIDLNIQSWDREGHYAKKVEVRSPEGELKWTWRSRELQPDHK